MGAAASGRRWRGAYTAQVFPPIVSYFTGWMMLLAYFIVCPWEAVAVGKLCGVHLSIAEFVRIVSGGGAARIPAAPGVGRRAHGFSCGAELPGHPLERQFSELDDCDGASSLRPPSWHQRRSRRSCQFSSGLSHDSLRIDPAYAPDRAVFHDRIRIGAQSGGGSPSGISFDRIFSRHHDGASRGRWFYVLAVAAVAYVAPWQGLIGKRFATAIAFEQALGAGGPSD